MFVTSMTATAKTTIYGTKNCWSLASDGDRDGIDGRECNVFLEIQGSDRDGYNLVMSPEGFFTADYHYSSKQEALDEAKELFGVSRNEWSEN